MFPSRQKYALQYGTGQDKVAAVLTDAGLVLVQHFEGDLQLREDIYLAPDKRAAVRAIEDDSVNIDVILIEAVDDSVLTDWYRRLAAQLDLARNQAIVARSFGLRGLAATLRTYSASTFQAIEGAFEDPRDDVRRIALLAAARFAWPQFVPLLARRVACESDLQIRSEVKEVLDLLRARLGPSGGPS
jgi:hypothetical protein